MSDDLNPSDRLRKLIYSDVEAARSAVQALDITMGILMRMAQDPKLIAKDQKHVIASCFRVRGEWLDEGVTSDSLAAMKISPGNEVGIKCFSGPRIWCKVVYISNNEIHARNIKDPTSLLTVPFSSIIDIEKYTSTGLIIEQTDLTTFVLRGALDDDGIPSWKSLIESIEIESMPSLHFKFASMPYCSTAGLCELVHLAVACRRLGCPLKMDGFNDVVSDMIKTNGLEKCLNMNKAYSTVHAQAIKCTDDAIDVD